MINYGKQKITSEKTCRNQVSRLHTFVNPKGRVILDYGCGKFDKGLHYLMDKGADRVAGFDPFNRSDSENEKAVHWMKHNIPDTVLCANVLNVIQEQEVRSKVIKVCRDSLNLNLIGEVYFSVYAGDNSGIPKKTKCGWQEHRKLKSYLPEIEPYFDKVEVKKNVIIATKNPVR